MVALPPSYFLEGNDLRLQIGVSAEPSLVPSFRLDLPVATQAVRPPIRVSYFFIAAVLQTLLVPV
jgi:hypothetical protein